MRIEEEITHKEKAIAQRAQRRARYLVDRVQTTV